MVLRDLEIQLDLYLQVCQIFQVVLVFQDVLLNRVLLLAQVVPRVLLALAVRADLRFLVFRVVQLPPKIM